MVVDDASGDQLRSLRAWLVDEDLLRGRVAWVERPVGPGALGAGIAEAFSVAAGSVEAISTLMSGIISWIRQRAGQRHPATPVAVTLTFADGAQVEISTTVAGEWSPAELDAQITRLTALVADHGAPGTASDTQEGGGRAGA
jgi:Effector Associated Constant Component 1